MNFVTLCCFCHGERWAWMNHVTICMPLHEAEDQRWQFEALRAESMLRAYLRPNEDLCLLCPCRETTLFCLSNQHRLTGHAKRYSSTTWSLCSVPALAMEIACFGDREDHAHFHTISDRLWNVQKNSQEKRMQDAINNVMRRIFSVEFCRFQRSRPQQRPPEVPRTASVPLSRWMREEKCTRRSYVFPAASCIYASLEV